MLNLPKLNFASINFPNSPKPEASAQINQQRKNIPLTSCRYGCQDAGEKQKLIAIGNVKRAIITIKDISQDMNTRINIYFHNKQLGIYNGAQKAATSDRCRYKSRQRHHLSCHPNLAFDIPARLSVAK